MNFRRSVARRVKVDSPQVSLNTVLLVEDDPLLNAVLESQLIDVGLRVITANNGLEALVRIAESPPHIIITDLMMPVMDGLALIEDVRKNCATRDIPIVAISASVHAMEKAIECGANQFLIKPFEAEDLHETVTTLLKSLKP